MYPARKVEPYCKTGWEGRGYMQYTFAACVPHPRVSTLTGQQELYACHACHDYALPECSLGARGRPHVVRCLTLSSRCRRTRVSRGGNLQPASKTTLRSIFPAGYIYMYNLLLMSEMSDSQQQGLQGPRLFVFCNYPCPTRVHQSSSSSPYSKRNRQTTISFRGRRVVN